MVIRIFGMIGLALISFVASSESFKIGDDVFVIATELNIREQPNISSKTIATIPIATKVIIIDAGNYPEGKETKWIKISVNQTGSEKLVGWAFKEYLSTTRPTLQLLESKFWQTPQENVDKRVMWAERAVALAPKEKHLKWRLADAIQKREIYNNAPEELRKLDRQVFRVGSVNGKTTLEVFSIGRHEFDFQPYHGKPCNESVALFPLLRGARADINAHGQIVAILECGIGHYGPKALVAAIFPRSNLNASICAAIVNVEAGELSVLGVRDMRRAVNGNYNIIAGTGGGDAGQVWGSVILFQLRRDCSYAIIHSENAGGHLGGEIGACSGDRIQERFISNSTVEITRRSMECMPPEKAMKPLKKIVHFPN